MNTASGSDASTARAEIDKIAASFRSASSSQENAPPPAASLFPQNSLKIKEIERLNNLKMNQPTDNESPQSSSSKLCNVFRSAFATIDIESDTFSVSSQTGFSSALLHEMELLQGKKRKENSVADGSALSVGMEPSSKRKRDDGFPHHNYQHGGGKESHQYGDVFDMSVESTREQIARTEGCNITTGCPETAKQQSSLVFSWVASRLRTAEQNMQKLFDDQEEAHRVEIEALKAEHARDKAKVSIPNADSHMATKQVELPVLETIEIEETDRSRVDQALESHLVLRRQLLAGLRENAHHDGLLREQLMKESYGYHSLRDAIYSQLSLQQCHHFNLQSINRSIIAEKNSELKRLGKNLDAKSAALRITQESMSRLIEESRVNFTRLQQLLHQEHLSGTQMKIQMQEMINANSQIITQQSALNTQAANENHSKEIKKMIMNHLGESKACNRRLEHMANEIKRLSTQNRELNEMISTLEKSLEKTTKTPEIKKLTAENKVLNETVSTLETSLEKTTKTLERLSERNLEYYNTIKKLNGKI